MCLVVIGRADLPECRETVHVFVPQGGQHEADRQDRARGQTAPGQNRVDESSTYPPVSIGEVVEGLELRVDQRRLDHGRVSRPIGVAHEVVEQAVEPSGIRRDEVGVEKGASPSPRSSSGQF